jgi:hypothetical protein
MRPIVYSSPENPNILAAKKLLKEREEARKERRIRDAERPVPNHICYKDSAFKDWKPGDKIPPCWVCGGLLHRNEHHICDGFEPMFVEHTPERKERWEAQREEIRETRRLGRGVFCTECGELMEDPEDAQWHAEDHGGKAYRELYALDGEPDGDLEGYDDEPEEDYCDEDDGYDCD